MNTSRPVTVLVVEDEPLIRMDIADELAAAGYRVLDAADAGEALQLLDARADVAVVFTDVNMPGPIDGLELGREVKRRWPEVELVVTSGRERPAKTALPPTARFLPKPYRVPDLCRILGELVAA
jgi:CheY-like chemotaxis protein